MDDYPNNSVSNRAEEPEPGERKRLKPVTTNARIRKKPLSRKLAESFTADDTGSVGSYILMEVMLPAAKNMVADAFSQGIERLLFGDGATTRSSSSSRTSGARRADYTNYSGVTSSSKAGRTTRPSARNDDGYAYSEVVHETRALANEVRDGLIHQLRQYGEVNVSDLYDLVGITSSFTDNKWGWDDLSGSSVRMVRGGGYIVDLPPAKYFG